MKADRVDHWLGNHDDDTDDNNERLVILENCKASLIPFHSAWRLRYSLCSLVQNKNVWKRKGKTGKECCSAV